MNNKYLYAYLIPLLIILTGNLIYSSVSIEKYNRGIVFFNGKLKVKIAFISPTIVHITSAPSILKSKKSLIVQEMNEPIPKWTLIELDDKVIIRTDSLQISLSRSTGDLIFEKGGKIIVKESGREFDQTILEDKSLFTIKQTFQLTKDEALYGLGQHHNGTYNYRNAEIKLIQDNTEVAVPFIVSTQKYGLLWDNYSETIFSDSTKGMSFHSSFGDNIDYYFIYGATIDKIIAQYRDLTGNAPMYPKWAYGYFQSRNRYWTQNELLSTVKKFRELSIPLDVIVLDYLHWGRYGFGSFRFDESFFPNPEQMIDSLHVNYNCKLMVSIWPSFTKKTPNWELMNSNGFLLDVNSYENTQVYDAFNPSAGKLYWDLILKSYYKIGVDGWWLDATEPEKFIEFANSKNYLGSSKYYLNTFSLVDVKNVYLGQRETSSGKRVFILTRSAFAGQQKYSAATWSGDIQTDFPTLKKSITAGLNFCMSGIPYWTTDIGGYKGGDPYDPAYRELYVRWFQYGTFSPLFRSHGRRAPGDRKTPNEVWSYGKEAQAVLTKFINLRYRLLPYIYSEAWKVTDEGSTLMRGLVFDFSNDKRVCNIDDQFMFGNSILVNPVVEQGAESRKLYLPSGTKWFDFWNGRKYEGGQTITADAALDKIPLFVKAGSIIPFGPFLQYSTEKLPDPIELRLYTGADAEFELFEDENDNYNYEKGIYSIIKITWNDRDRTLTFSERKGEYPGMMKERRFNAIIVSADHGAGIEIENKIDKIINYSGNELVIRF